MNEVFLFLAAPFVMCLILVGIHCYLGLHVLARGVIFVDLALAQVAALGTTVAYLWGHEHSGEASYMVSLGFTICAALFFSLANRFRSKVSQEAMIGIVYALGSAAVILLVDRMSHGAEHIKYAMVGQILWVTWSDVWATALIYSGVAFLHYLFRGPLLQASFGKRDHWFWDFLFYALFGVVITSSVHVAGVLLVFAFLIVPAVASTFFFSSISSRLLFGWGLGFALSVIGMGASYAWDLPAGAVIVVVFTAVPVLGTILLGFTRLFSKGFLALRR
jgi:zinc/manganese transport system permease protein